MIKIFINCKFKNTLITITEKNNVIFKTSSKSFNLKTKYKNNPYIFKKIVDQILGVLKLNSNNPIIFIKGYGPGRYNLIKQITKKIRVLYIFDISNNPFNGCKQKKLQRK